MSFDLIGEGTALTYFRISGTTPTTVTIQLQTSLQNAIENSLTVSRNASACRNIFQVVTPYVG